MKKWHLISLAAVGVLAGLQWTNPARTNLPVKLDALAATQPPAPVAAALRAACYDCHSQETKWPFYARVAPVSWLVAADVNEGRERLNFSDWPASDDARAAKKLERINEVLDYREMPPKKYTLLHPQARLTEDQRQQIMTWTETRAKQLRATSTNP